MNICVTTQFLAKPNQRRKLRRKGIRKMGAHSNIGYDKFPKQGDLSGKEVKVYFNFDTSRIITGTVIRDDAEEPGLMLIQLSDGRVVRSTECQYSW